ncbi:MAG: hypothetical protein BMS9Abin29_1052 [Gemmatimonadota bacterium]|nr:MAG: hypothetical protein BMS9Abin29_1052 [Gemmatimonadota bacterium]
MLAGGGLGFLSAVGIYFEPAEPYPGFVTIAGTLLGITTGLLITTVVTRASTVLQSLIWGALFGLLPSLMVFFAKGGWTSWDAPFVVPTAVGIGAILGPVIRWASRKAT